MPASLSAAQVARYRRDGYLFQIDCLTAEDVLYHRGRLEAFEQEQGDTFGKSPGLVRSKSHLLFSWMDELVRHPKVLDAVESISNLLSRGQTIEHNLDANYVMMPLKAGQISLHHTLLVHSSEPNRTDRRRIGIGISYIPTHCRLVNEDVPVTAALVRGHDEVQAFRSGAAAGGRLQCGLTRRACRGSGAVLQIEQAAGDARSVGQCVDLTPRRLKRSVPRGP